MTASPLTAECKFCSEVSKANGEDPIGSANPTGSWLVMELPLLWTEERFHHDPILQPIHDLFHELFDQGIRVAPMAIALPPLQSGDRLTRPEFERLYAASPHIKKAELIEGVVYVASPLRHEQHGKPHSRVITWLGVYQALTPGVDLSDAPTVRLDLDNEPQPDAVLFIEPSVGGQTRLSDDGYIEGAPELIVEIAASSVAIDSGSRKQVYRRNGVPTHQLPMPSTFDSVSAASE